MIDVETIFDSDREEYEFMQQKKEQPMKEQIEEKHALSESIYMSGHGLDWKDSDDIAEQLYTEGYRKQEWISVFGFERYSVNEYGIVKNNETDQILLPTKNKAGYLMVCLYGNNIKKNLRVHRIVAQAFIPNPQNKPCVNHKNGTKTDNRVCNLEWVTSGENNLHKCRVLGKKSTNEPTPKVPVKCVETGEIFESRSDAARRYRTQAVHIFECCNGKRKTAGGVHWMPLPEPPKMKGGAE